MKKILFFILLLLISSICFSSLNAKIVLYHEQPISIKQGVAPTLTLEAVDGYESIERAWIYYRETGALSYNEKEMQAGSETNPNYIVTLDEIQNYKTDLEYYFLVKNKNRTNFFLPKHEPQLNPFRVSIEALTRDYQTEKNIIISAATYKLTEEKIVAKYLDEASVKGKRQKIKIYEVIDIN